MTKCALVTHFTGLNSQENFIYYPFFNFLANKVPPYYLKKIIQYMPPHKILFVKNIISISGSEASGYAIMCPLLPEHFVARNNEKAIKKIIQSCRLAEKLGAHVVGLAAFTSVIGNEGEEVAKKVNIAVTSGNTFTAFLAIDALLKATESLTIDKNKAKLVVLGATGDIGSICTKILSKKFNNIILLGREESKLKLLISGLDSNKSIRFNTDVKKSISEADLILCVASNISSLFNAQDLKQGAVVCDVSIPPAIPKTKENFREDVLIFDGGKAKFINNDRIIGNKWHKLFPDGIIYGCLAETILLALEGKIENFSIGRGNITEEKVIFISELAQKHGFSTAPFKFGNYIYSEEDIKRIKGIIRRNNSKI